MDDLLYALSLAPAAPDDAPRLDVEAGWAALGRDAGPLPLDVDPRDPDAAALAGLWVVLAAERPELRPALLGRAALELVRANPPLAPPPALALWAGVGPLSEVLRLALPDDARGDAIAVVPVDPPPDAPTRALVPADLRRLARATVADLEERAAPRMLVVTTAEAWTGRPLGGPAAVAAAAAAAWAAGRGAALLHLGPFAAEPGARRFGLRALGPPEVRAAARAAAREGRWLAIDAEWGEALAAFPHLRPLAGALARGASALDVVRGEVSRVLGTPRPPIDRPLRELGMDSLQLEELRRRLGERFGAELGPDVLFRYPTVAALAGALGRAR